MGFVVKSANGNFYYSGDTALTLDMQLICSFVPPDFSILPIGDNFTMGFEDAARAAHMLQCRKVIGVHQGTFGLITIDIDKAKSHFVKQGLELIIPVIGNTIEI